MPKETERRRKIQEELERLAKEAQDSERLTEADFAIRINAKG